MSCMILNIVRYVILSLLLKTSLFVREPRIHQESSFSIPMWCTSASYPTEGDGGAECPTLTSYILHNSLAYGADWSRLTPDQPPPASPEGSPRPPETYLAEGVGHLRIQYESPTASFDTSLEDDAGHYIPEGLAPAAPPPPPPTASGATPPPVSALLASCSFYDHMLHLWRWDYSTAWGSPSFCRGNPLFTSQLKLPRYPTNQIYSLKLKMACSCWYLGKTEDKREDERILVWKLLQPH